MERNGSQAGSSGPPATSMMLALLALGPLAVLPAADAPVLHAPAAATRAELAGEPLLQLSDLVYQGAFLVPDGQFGTDPNAVFDYSDNGLAYCAADNSLYLKGHVYGQLTAEISIPAPVNSTNLDDLNTATVLQDFADITEGNLNQEDVGNGVILGGMLAYDNALIGAVYGYYDAAGQQTKSHFVSGLDLSATGVFHGLYHVGPPDMNPHFLGGYMTVIPAEWQAAMGGPCLTGHAEGNIISVNSCGPSAAVFDPATLETGDPPPASLAVGYPLSNPTLGTWSGNGTPNPIYNMCSATTGIVWVPGTRTILFFGSTGLGVSGYGEGTSDPSLAGTPTPDGSVYVYDPVDSSKGCHAYPYSAYVWLYDAEDFLSVLSGAQNPWDIVPYASGNLALPFDSGSNYLNGAAYDPGTGNIYVSQANTITTDYQSKPVLHVFTISPGVFTNGGTGSGTTATGTGTGTGTGVSGTGGSTAAGATGGDGGDGGSGHCGFGTSWSILVLLGAALSARQWRRRAAA